ncbi:MAG: sensor histidine kinase [Desulfobulbaceae bacterium]|nr:sensor histidine kinase [Desulfobulbaceae bacterium]
MKLFPRFNYFIAIFIYLLVIGWNVWWTFTWLYHQRLRDLAEEGSSRLELYVTYLQGVLEKYENIPELLANDQALINLLNDHDNPEKIDFLNRYLEKINNVSNASDTYLMDKNGLTIAASNWKGENPFVGQNFSYRPYFKEAMEGRLGRYFALGTTSSLRGYYFAYPVRQNDSILGALVIKINIDSVENNWGREDQTFIVTDSNGVIFLSTNKDWRLRTLTPLPKVLYQSVVESRRYPDASLESLDIVREQSIDSGHIIRVKLPKDNTSKKFLLQNTVMQQAGWTVQILTDTNRVERFVFYVFLVISSVLVLAGLLTLVLRQRRQRKLDLRCFEEQARKVLQQANEELESRVSERTKALTKMNSLLRKEIDDRRRAEIALQNTRSELVHAAKMAALGQMSAGINHELNQPLAAIRSYSDNGKLFLQKGRLEDTMWNLEHISELTDRMAQIGVQLKQFSRKTSGQMTTVPLHGVIDGALEILGPIIRKSAVKIDVLLQPENIKVCANLVMLQQVIVNLIGNALHAVEGLPIQKVGIRACPKEGKIAITVDDNGTGIPPEHLPHIFEPFFTTKQSGQGLGLGLTITERILHEMNGEIHVLESQNGAKFLFTLEEA